MSIQFTPEQLASINAEIKKFSDRLLPAKLKNTNSNGALLADYCVERNWPRTGDSLYEAAKIIYASLKWDVKPAKLLREESQSKAVKNQSEQESLEPFLDQKA